jgi:hypothetical protein
VDVEAVAPDFFSLCHVVLMYFSVGFGR